MRKRSISTKNRVLFLFLTAVVLAPLAAAGSGFGRFQHGGRATGQVGAFTARAADPSAVFYNPAAITRLPGKQLLGGFDFNNATDEYESSTGSHSADHIIEFPPAVYFTWNDAGGGSPWAFGIGLDTPEWYDVNWNPVFFQGRFLTRRSALELWELHPVLAYSAGDWSFGGGLRYVQGTFLQGNNILGEVTGSSGPVTVEAMSLADTDIDGFAFDLAVHYETPAWGWGAVYRSATELDGDGDLTFTPRDLPADPVLEQRVRELLFDRDVRATFDLPWELRTGVWIAPYPELRLELDLAFQAWSELEISRVELPAGDPLRQLADLTKIRAWDDVLSVRFALEGDINDQVTLGGGVSWEPSPVPSFTTEPGFPRDDAIVLAAGLTYNFPDISFDLGYSLHLHDDRRASGQERLNPGVDGEYRAEDTVWSASVRWRF